MSLKQLQRLVGLLVFALLCAGHAQAQATRTWISGVGDDVNPCSRTAPCKTFAGAISKTAAGGTIDVLDPGGFGAVTITKSITLESVGAIGSVLAAGTHGVIVNAAGAVVVLRGLSIDGAGSGLDGVRFLQGAALIVEDCDIGNFTRDGIDFIPSSAATLTVRDTTIHHVASADTSSYGGILVGTGPVHALLQDVRLLDGGFGLQVQGPASVTVRDSIASGNAGYGFAAASSGEAASLILSRVTASNNALGGVAATGGAALVRISDSTVTGNSKGLFASGGQIVSFGNNRIVANTLDGAPTGTAVLK